jgi:hypothetical protein
MSKEGRDMNARLLALVLLPTFTGCATLPSPTTRAQLDTTPISKGVIKKDPSETATVSGKSMAIVSDDIEEGPSLTRPVAGSEPVPMNAASGLSKDKKPQRFTPIDRDKEMLPDAMTQVPVKSPMARPGAIQQVTGHSGLGDSKRSPQSPDGTEPGMRKIGPETVLDPHCRNSPTASGCLINLGPNETGLERAIELAKRLDTCEADKRALAERLAASEALLASREKMLRDDEAEITKATQDLIQTRAELQKLREELSKFKKKLRDAEKEDIETLKSIVIALDKFLKQNSN